MLNVTYIYHSSFLVETDEHLLLFDYYKGKLPVMAKDKPLYIFASHRHEDHFSPEIFSIAEKNEKARLVLSSDISAKKIPEKLRERCRRIKPGEHFAQGSLFVRSLRSTDEGVAFVVESAGKGIYHAGDLNYWRWEGEPEAWNRRMREDYQRQIDLLAEMELYIHCAFVVLDGRQKQDAGLGMDYFLRKIPGEAVFPMHFWERYQVIDRYIKSASRGLPVDRVVRLSFPGQSFAF